MDQERRFPAAAFVALLVVGSLPVVAAVDWMARQGAVGFSVAMALLLGIGVPAGVSFYRWDKAERDADDEQRDVRAERAVPAGPLDRGAAPPRGDFSGR